MKLIIKSVNVEIEYPDGQTLVHNICPKSQDGIFWGDSTVNVLGAFYDNNNTYMTTEELIVSFGKHRAIGCINNLNLIKNSEDKYLINKDIINYMWNTPDENGVYTVILGKSPFCKPSDPLI